MLKIVKGMGCGSYSFGEPVKIDNTVYIPGEDKETGEFISAEEQKRRAEEEKAAEEKRFNEAVEAKVAQIVAQRSAAIEQERDKVIEKAKADAAAIAADAKAATMSVMEKAQRECAILKEQARKEGYDEGFADGRSESLDKYKKYVDAAGKLLSEINSRKEAYYISNEEEMRETVFDMVRKIVRTEIRTNPQAIESIMAEAARNFRNSDYLKITLAEDNITERFRTDEKLVKELIPFIPEIEVELDKDAEEGTVIEDDGSQIVDAGVPTQLEFLKEVLKNARGEADETAGELVPEGLTVEGGGADTLEAIAERSDEAARAETVPEGETEMAEEVPENGNDAAGDVNMSDFANIMAEIRASGVSEGKTEENASGGAEENTAAGTVQNAAEPAAKKKKTKPRTAAAENAE